MSTEATNNTEQTPENGSAPETKPTEKTYSEADYNKMLERARTLEAENVNYQKTYKGIDPEKYAATLEENRQLQQDAAKTPEELEKVVREQVVATVSEEITGLREENTSLKARNLELEVVDVAFSQAAGKFNEDCHEDIKGYLRRNCTRTDDGSIVIKDKKGAIRTSPTDPAKNMTVEQYIAELMADKPSWVKSTAIPGSKQAGDKSGARQNGAGGAVALPPDFHGWKNADKIQFFKDNPKCGPSS